MNPPQPQPRQPGSVRVRHRMPEATEMMASVCQGSLTAENELIVAFITAIDGKESSHAS